MLYALARAGAAPSLAKVDVQYDTPARSIAVTGAVNLVCLFLWAARSDAMSYSGNIVTVGTLALILVYIGVTGALAISAFRCRHPIQWLIGSLGALLLLWPLWNSLYPVPDWPGNMWPYVVAAWLALGAAIARLRPSLTLLDVTPPKPRPASVGELEPPRSIAPSSAVNFRRTV